MMTSLDPQQLSSGYAQHCQRMTQSLTELRTSDVISKSPPPPPAPPERSSSTRHDVFTNKSNKTKESSCSKPDAALLKRRFSDGSILGRDLVKLKTNRVTFEKCLVKGGNKSRTGCEEGEKGGRKEGERSRVEGQRCVEKSECVLGSSEKRIPQRKSCLKKTQDVASIRQNENSRTTPKIDTESGDVTRNVGDDGGNTNNNNRQSAAAKTSNSSSCRDVTKKNGVRRSASDRRKSLGDLPSITTPPKFEHAVTSAGARKRKRRRRRPPLERAKSLDNEDVPVTQPGQLATQNLKLTNSVHGMLTQFPFAERDTHMRFDLEWYLSRVDASKHRKSRRRRLLERTRLTLRKGRRAMRALSVDAVYWWRRVSSHKSFKSTPVLCSFNDNDMGLY